MVRQIANIAEIAGNYDAIVLDQWGVLHDGTAPYPDAIPALTGLRDAGHTLAVLSNSGKRSAPNQARIEAMGFPPDLFGVVMSSGEALWRDIGAGKIADRRFFATERVPGDAAAWAEGLDITLCDDVSAAEAVLLMGLPDDSDLSDWEDLMVETLDRGLPVYCSNPDRKSVRANGVFALQPGAIAHALQDRGAMVAFYGKPHRPIFTALEAALGVSPERLLMVGDSLEHDIGGAQDAGWDSVFVCGGIHRGAVSGNGFNGDFARLAASKGVAPPTYAIEELK